MLITLKELLKDAEKAKTAVIAPDFTTLVVARAMIEQAEELEVPLVLSYSNSFRSIREVPDYAAFIHLIIKEIEQACVPICLHLDHAGSLDEIKEAVDVGFTSVMIDVSDKAWEENLEWTRQAIEIAHPYNVSVESELGRIASGKGYITKNEAETFYTDPDKAEQFVKNTGIDALAVSIGNIHGFYTGEPKIDFPRLEILNQRVQIPLVLHGTSGIGAENIKKAISLGIRKINIYSAIVQSMHMEMKTALEDTLFDPIGVINALRVGVKSAIKEYVLIVNSATQENE